MKSHLSIIVLSLALFACGGSSGTDDSPNIPPPSTEGTENGGVGEGAENGDAGEGAENGDAGEGTENGGTGEGDENNGAGDSQSLVWDVQDWDENNWN